MAISPVFLAMKPNVMGACIWQIFMTVGQVLWSPRQDSWIGKIFYTFVYWIVEACTLMLSCPKPTLSLFMCRTPGQMKRIESTTSTTPKSCSKYALKIAGLAPTGVEGLFFAVGSSRALLAPLGDLAMGMMNEKYNANCPGESPLWHYHLKSLCCEAKYSETNSMLHFLHFSPDQTIPDCRDQYGHFCKSLIDTGKGADDALQCSSVQESCDIFLGSRDQGCPATCAECPSWEPSNPSTFWYILAAASIASP